MLEQFGIRYWLDGGWGVDALVGRQTREHRDVDIDFDAGYTEELRHKLEEKGYEVVTDWSPVRIELYHPQLSYIDIHPVSYTHLDVYKRQTLSSRVGDNCRQDSVFISSFCKSTERGLFP